MPIKMASCRYFFLACCDLGTERHDMGMTAGALKSKATYAEDIVASHRIRNNFNSRHVEI